MFVCEAVNYSPRIISSEFQLELAADVIQLIKIRHTHTRTHTHTHTTILWPFFRDYPGEPVTEENLLDFMV